MAPSRQIEGVEADDECVTGSFGGSGLGGTLSRSATMVMGLKSEASGFDPEIDRSSSAGFRSEL
jgi:hypothetical protein